MVLELALDNHVVTAVIIVSTVGGLLFVTGYAALIPFLAFTAAFMVCLREVYP